MNDEMYVLTYKYGKLSRKKYLFISTTTLFPTSLTTINYCLLQFTNYCDTVRVNDII